MIFYTKQNKTKHRKTHTNIILNLGQHVEKLKHSYVTKENKKCFNLLGKLFKIFAKTSTHTWHMTETSHLQKLLREIKIYVYRDTYT